jgi:dynein heavy chain
MPDLAKFDEAITKYSKVAAEINSLDTISDIGWIRVNSAPIKLAMSTWASKWVYQYSSYLYKDVVERLIGLDAFMTGVVQGLEIEVEEGNKQALRTVMSNIRDVRKNMDATAEMFEPLRNACQLLKTQNIQVEELTVADKSVADYLEEVPREWDIVVNKTFKKKEDTMPLQVAETDNVKQQLEDFYLSMRAFRNAFRKDAPFTLQGDPTLYGAEAYTMIDKHAADLIIKEEQATKFNELEELFELPVSKYVEVDDTRSELVQLKKLWDFKVTVMYNIDSWKKTLWSEIETEVLEDENKRMLKMLREFGNKNPVVKGWEVFRHIEGMLKNMQIILPLVNDLHAPSMRDRHWSLLSTVCHKKALDPQDEAFSLNDLIELKLHEHVDDVSDIVETANKELKIEKKLTDIEKVWKGLELDYVPHKDSEVSVIRPAEEVIEFLETHQMELQGIIGMGKFVDYFRDRVESWQGTLGNVESTLKEWSSVSKQWMSLESIFLASADIRSQLPDDTKRFEGIDSEFKDIMKESVSVSSVVEVCLVEGRLEQLKTMTQRLAMCQKSLNEYLDMKKKIFPRFYFVSNVALLEILSNGNNPPKIMPFLGDCYDSLANLEFVEGSTSVCQTMVAKDGEKVPMPPLKDGSQFTIVGAVENWLNDVTEEMRRTLRIHMADAVETAVNWEVEKPRHKWLFDYPAQILLNVALIYWTEETEQSLEEFEGGQEDSVKRYAGVTVSRLTNLIQLVLGQLSKQDRTKIIALITLDVHGRDVVQKLVDQKAAGPSSFLWQQQLRFQWQQDTQDTNIKICDFRSKYSYEWIGNTGRLVITPLTDRCYITLTMALRLFLGGAPAGPAGTGKTETTKDLARALALCCYVFNCSDQMNYQTMADIFRGLAQTGTWGCFDEFNRISIEVLSVVATQVKTVQDCVIRFAVPGNREEEYQHFPSGTPPNKVGYFDFMGDRIALIPTAGFFITMNPGYAGRTELPENLKALFRSCAMIRPDLKPICENMLMSEGFQMAKKLSLKFVTLYQLSSELLSPQPHYDWGLRAVKSVLRVAGMLKRQSPDMEEDLVLMRALRDFNTPKIPAHDTPIFLRLVSDLFMGLEVNPSVNEDLKAKAVEVCKLRGLQYDPGFVLKVTQFQELLDVRHSVMLVGAGGSGKTTIWNVLAGCHNLGKKRPTCVCETVNPKSVNGDELYGYMTLAKDWKDGVLSIIMRGMAKNYAEQSFHSYQTYKWVVLDGDIDAIWIESMNTVMDDNKVLTLVSNERIPLSDAMRMVFEINTLKNATPATVSRAGILYINETDIGWRPFMETWVARREDETERTYLPGLFDKYIEACQEMMRKGYKRVSPQRIINVVCTICYLLDVLLPDLTGEKKTKENIESMFVYTATWAFGGPLNSRDQRKHFHESWCQTFPTVKYPKEGLCFDYYWDVEQDDFAEWKNLVPEYRHSPISSEHPFSSVYVETVETTRLEALMDYLVQGKNGNGGGNAVLLVGTAGTGKTALIRNYLHHLTEEDRWLSDTISMNYFVDAGILQRQLEAPIDKRSGKIFGPPATKKMVYFVDDLNLPYIEEYGTQSSIELLRQLIDYESCFDRDDPGFRKEFKDIQFVAAMNPTAGSFEVNERLQRHFALFGCIMPEADDLRTIYLSMLDGHVQTFPSSVRSISNRVVDASISLHEMIASKFLPSATKFVYNWNMRELTNIFTGVTRSRQDYFPSTMKFIRLWVHECHRVFGDRLINETEQNRFQEMLAEATKRHFEEPQEEIHTAPNIFTTFTTTTSGDPAYLPVTTMESLKATLDDSLIAYNESYAIMDLVLFDNAMEHVTRIARIIQTPGGNAMLIGVGGSGKQSLSKLATYICGYESVLLSVSSSFKVEDLKESIRGMYKQAGIKGIPTVWIMTDQQIVNEQFLIYINNFLSSGWIPDLYPKERPRQRSRVFA